MGPTTIERIRRVARAWGPAAWLAIGGLWGLASCSVFEHGEGLNVRSVPPDQRADYAVFAHRCSKCHSLARPLNSGITKDEYWRIYVERMRRQPSSGISAADTVPILRFLHWYSNADKEGGSQW
ncbi:MAG: hypothetical protein FWD17_16385 [Polyangiaceae bacterium]|nr:hypothetical protein [Polyangiaceae bacterium]